MLTYPDQSYLSLWIAFSSSLCLAGDSPDIRQMPNLLLTLGEQRLLHVPQLTRYALGNHKVKVLKLPAFKGDHATPQNSLLLKATEEGICDLWVWKSDGTSEHRSIIIQRRDLNRAPSALELSAEKLTEVEVLYAGTHIVLRGEILSLRESSRIASLVRDFPREVRDETYASTDLLQRAWERCEHWLKRSGYSHLRLEKIGSALWVRGSLDDPSHSESIKRQLLNLFPLLNFDLESLPDRAPTLSFKVFLLELKKNHLNSLGLFWGSTTPVQFQISPGPPPEPLKIDLAIQHLEGQGNAKVLSNPELVVRAPGEAELFAGGELPITVRTRFNSNIHWKKYGLTLKLKVSHIAGNRVRLDVLTEVSHLGPATTDGGIPGIQSNRMTTQVDAQFGVPLLLSGLLQDQVREEAKGLPSLRSIPILGGLFGSEDYLNERSELVAILLPRLSPPPISAQRLQRETLLRPLPRPTDRQSLLEEMAIKSHPEFPWNALN